MREEMVSERSGAVSPQEGAAPPALEKSLAPDLLQTIVADSPLAIAVFDPSGRLMHANTAWNTLFDKDITAQGRTFEALFPSHGPLWRQTHEICMGGSATQLDTPFLHLSGATVIRRWIQWRANPWIANSGHIAGVVFYVTDTADLHATQEELKQAQNEIPAVMSHELRTPMNAIIGMARLLEETELSASQHEYLEILTHSAESLLNILDTILDLSRIESGRLELAPAPFDLRDMVERLCRVLVTQAMPRGVDLFVHYPLNVPSNIVADAVRIRQVLANLVANAIKFTEKGHVLVKVECPDRTDTTATLRLSVADTGIGIAREHQTRIFQKFHQAEPATARRYGGTGLGLAIASRLVEMMGGRLEVDSAPGQGSSFHFALDVPLNVGCALDFPAAASLRGRRILVVGRPPVGREILLEHLTYWDIVSHHIDTLENGVQMLRATSAAGRPFHIALIDADTISEVRRSPGTLDRLCAEGWPPICLMSYDPRMQDELACSGVSGAIPVIRKPLAVAQLLHALVAAGRDQSESPLAPPKQNETPTNSSAPTSHCSSAGPRILLVEDNRANQQVALGILRRMGLTATIASNGQEAIQQFQQAEFDVIFMDCAMPTMDGYEATRRIRALEDGRRHTPIVALTAHTLNNAAEECLSAGMDAYLAKPITREALCGILQETRNQWSIQPIVPLSAPCDENSAPPSTAAPHLDKEHLLQLVQGDIELLEQAIAAFREDTPPLIAALEAALEAHDLNRVGRLAHTLGGSAINLGGGALGKSARALEQAAIAGDDERCLNLAPDLRHRYETMIALLNELSA